MQPPNFNLDVLSPDCVMSIPALVRSRVRHDGGEVFVLFRQASDVILTFADDCANSGVRVISACPGWCRRFPKKARDTVPIRKVVVLRSLAPESYLVLISVLEKRPRRYPSLACS